jgi:fatty acid desaturase
VEIPIEIENNKIRLIQILWLSFIIELVLFFVLTYFFLMPDILQTSEDQSALVVLYLSYLISIISIPLSFKLYDNVRKKTSSFKTEQEKAEKYFFSKLIAFAIIEIPAVLCLLAFYMTEVHQPLYMYGIIFVTGLLLKPSRKQFTKDFLLEINDDSSGEIVYLPDEQKKEYVDNEK